MTGHLGVRSAGMNPLRGQNNVQGANDAGATPIFYPGYQRVTDDAVRGKFERPGASSSPDEGMNLNVMMKELARGKVKGLFVMGEDIVISEPNVSQIEQGLNEVRVPGLPGDLPQPDDRYADVVFPAACFAEKDGVFTNSDRRVQRVRKAVDPPGEAREDWRILCDLARAPATRCRTTPGPHEVYDEMASLTPKFAGISHAAAGRAAAGLQWPCPDERARGHADAARGRAGDRQGAVPGGDLPAQRRAAGRGLPAGAFHRTRTLYHYNAATQTRRESGPVAKQNRQLRRDAPPRRARLGIGDGETVRVVSRRGAVEAEA